MSMEKSLQQIFNKKLVTFIFIFIFSYLILSFNLDMQGIDVDEGYHHGFSMAIFDLMTEGEFFDPCITGKGTCELIDISCPGQSYWFASGGFVRGFFVGLGDYFFSDDERIYYASSDVECRSIHHNTGIRGESIPSQSELTAARFFSPIFGALVVSVSFQIGKILFNRPVGITFSLILLFHAIWMHYSRTLLLEVYTSFFVIIGIFLLLYSLNQTKNITIKYFILSAIFIGIALNIKITSIEIVPVLIIIIFFRNSWKDKLKFKDFLDKKKFLKSSVFFVIFFGIVGATFFGINPYYYDSPVEQFKKQFGDAKSEYSILKLPWENPKRVILPIVESATILPIFEIYYTFSGDEMPTSLKFTNEDGVEETAGNTFSSVPLSVFFIIGIGLLLWKISRNKITYGELVIISWYVSIFIILSSIIESYNSTRHFLPIVFPMILIMAYGFTKFLNIIINYKEKIILIILTFFGHFVTVMIFWEYIYFKPEFVWRLPSICVKEETIDVCIREHVSLSEALGEPIVLVSSIIFVSSIVVFFIKNRIIPKNS